MFFVYHLGANLEKKKKKTQVFSIFIQKKEKPVTQSYQIVITGFSFRMFTCYLYIKKIQGIFERLGNLFCHSFIVLVLIKEMCYLHNEKKSDGNIFMRNPGTELFMFGYKINCNKSDQCVKIRMCK